MALKKGQKARINYIGRLADGTVFDSSSLENPLEFTVGAGEILPAFEEACMELVPGCPVRVTIAAERAFGPTMPERIHVVARELLPHRPRLKAGMSVLLRNSRGEYLDARVLKTDESSVTLDFNHPLAGQNLDLEIELLK